MKCFIGVDPGKRPGVVATIHIPHSREGLYFNRYEVESTPYTIRNLVYSMMLSCRNAVADEGGVSTEFHVAIEDQYVAKDPSATIKLAHNAGALAQEFGWRGAKVTFVQAQIWQTAMLGRFGGKKRADRKKAAAILATSTFPELRGQPQDVLDAACIALWASRFLR